MLHSSIKSSLFYEIFPDEHLMFEYWSGLVSLSDYLNFKISFSTDPLYNSNYKLIVDRRDSSLIIKYNELEKLKSYLNKNSFILTNNRTAHVTSTPEQVVQSTFFEIVKNTKSEKLRIVSTLEAAFQFLNIDFCYLSEITAIINQFKAGSYLSISNKSFKLA